MNTLPAEPSNKFKWIEENYEHLLIHHDSGRSMKKYIRISLFRSCMRMYMIESMILHKKLKSFRHWSYFVTWHGIHLWHSITNFTFCPHHNLFSTSMNDDLILTYQRRKQQQSLRSNVTKHLWWRMEISDNVFTNQKVLLKCVDQNNV